jgi:DMSO/TMAO reductase YedYZ molybdopterin-dependent catalytic subunit
MSTIATLPPGQREIEEFPRFGLKPFANRFPKNIDVIAFEVSGDVERSLSVADQFHALTDVEQVSDFHCVTTWSHLGLRWRGVLFRDFYEKLVVPEARPDKDAGFIVFRAQDGYSQCLLLEDLLADDVLLAHTLDGSPLSIAHGTPLRLIAPAHYGYKNIKHIKAIEFWRDARKYRFPGPSMMDHQRARVAREERGVGLPGWMLRHLYRLLVPSTIKAFRDALENHAKRPS